MLCFDIGANIGRWTDLNKNNYTKIIAIDGSLNIYQILKKHLEQFSNCECINYVVCNNNNNPINFYECNTNLLSTINKELYENQKSRYYNKFTYEEKIYNSITLDKLIEIYGIPDLIKIDVVLGEFSVISSLHQKVPLICFNWFSEFNEISFNCLDYLLTLGFNNFYIQYEDKYDFKPNDNEYNSIELIKDELNKTIPKEHWGMIWCK
jgi:FkbM family methyltransferase